MGAICGISLPTDSTCLVLPGRRTFPLALWLLDGHSFLVAMREKLLADSGRGDKRRRSRPVQFRGCGLSVFLDEIQFLGHKRDLTVLFFFLILTFNTHPHPT